MSEWTNEREMLCKCAFEWQIFIAEERHYAGCEVNEGILKGKIEKWMQKCQRRKKKTIAQSDIKQGKKPLKGKIELCIQLNWKRKFSIVQSL